MCKQVVASTYTMCKQDTASTYTMCKQALSKKKTVFYASPYRVGVCHDNLDDELDENEKGTGRRTRSCLVDLCHCQPPTLQKHRCAAIVW